MRARRYKLEQIMSGTHQGCFWVTLGFRSPGVENDVLHIVTGKATTATRRPRRGRPYLERYDQSLSCDEGAELVEVRSKGITIHLTRSAQMELNFDRPVLFFSAPSTRGSYSKALEKFCEMASVTERVLVGRGARTRKAPRSSSRGLRRRRRT